MALGDPQPYQLPPPKPAWQRMAGSKRERPVLVDVLPDSTKWEDRFPVRVQESVPPVRKPPVVVRRRVRRVLSEEEALAKGKLLLEQRCRKYGITVDQYEGLYASTKGICPICEDRPINYIDHDHETGEVRGLLCWRCNTLLGWGRDKVSVLQRAIDYLARGGVRSLDAD